VPGNTSFHPNPENDGVPNALAASPTYEDYDPNFGVVLYTHGLALDQPLSVTRLSYEDQPYGDTYELFPPISIVPIWNYRAVDDIGIPPTFIANNCVSARCYQSSWAYSYGTTPMWTYNPYVWHGSMLNNKSNATGTLYRRARVYDPVTGRFTQEDPAGLAGGLNTYGFAGGDPVNFIDPFGSRPCPPDNDCGALVAALTMTGAVIGGLGGGVAGGIGGLGCGPGALVCTPAAAAAVSVEGAAAGATFGAGVGIFFTRQGDAVDRARSLNDQVDEHLNKLETDPESQDAPHWTSEIKSWLKQMERATEKMGKRTARQWKEIIQQATKRLKSANPTPPTLRDD